MAPCPDCVARLRMKTPSSSERAGRSGNGRREEHRPFADSVITGKHSHALTLLAEPFDRLANQCALADTATSRDGNDTTLLRTRGTALPRFVPALRRVRPA